MMAISMKQRAIRVKRKIERVGWTLIGIMALVLVGVLLLAAVSENETLKDSIVTFIIVGFLAQIIDGALGMAYGVSSTTFLLSTGISPAAASASVHVAEVFTTFVSGVAHWRLGNVDKSIFSRLVIPGILGGVTGAYILSNVSGDTIKPFISFYLMLMGVRILWKAFSRPPVIQTMTRHLFPLGLVGGFFDAIGGGGWGPVVTTTLVARGNEPRTTIGSVNTAEFFVTFAESVTFLLAVKFSEYSTVILGLMIGGVLAAPMAAYVCKKLSARKLMVVVGALIVGLSLRTLIMTL
ncbi:MAG: sulfite exporter TauE/SafE family protein [Anaerolineae bacterium]|nr:sulfite exporter TauE/SafE family protein [Anaerolineae bacterium]